MSTVIERLNITAILMADPIPDEPMTLAELHKANGGFPFKAKRVIDVGNSIKVGDIVNVYSEHVYGHVSKDPSGLYRKCNDPGYLTDWFIHSNGQWSDNLDEHVAVWTFA